LNGCEFSPRLSVPRFNIDNARAAREAIDHLYRLAIARRPSSRVAREARSAASRLRGATAGARAPKASRELIVMHGRLLDRVGMTAAALGWRENRRRRPSSA